MIQCQCAWVGLIQCQWASLKKSLYLSSVCFCTYIYLHLYLFSHHSEPEVQTHSKKHSNLTESSHWRPYVLYSWSSPVLHQGTSITPRHQYYTKPVVLPQDTSAPTTTVSITPSQPYTKQDNSITPGHQYYTKTPVLHQASRTPEYSIHGEEEAHRTPGWPSASFTLSRILILISSRLSPPHSQQQVGW